MASRFTFYRAGIVFWLFSFILVFMGIFFLSGYTIESVVLIMSGVATFLLGGLAIIYGELAKGE